MMEQADAESLSRNNRCSVPSTRRSMGAGALRRRTLPLGSAHVGVGRWMVRHDLRSVVHDPISSGPGCSRGHSCPLAGWAMATYPPHQSPPTRTPLDILKERFARGEIDKAEFEDRRRVL